MFNPTKGWLVQELSIINQAKISFSRKIYPKDVPQITGTCLYTFGYKGDNPSDKMPLVALVGRGSSGPFFRFPIKPGSSAWGTYLAAINLHYITPGLKEYIIKRYGKLPYIPSREAEKLGLFHINYRIYHVSGITGLHPVSPEVYSLLTQTEEE